MWGEDFSHIYAEKTFLLMDQLIERLQNEKSTPKIKFKFATISEYFETVHK